MTAQTATIEKPVLRRATASDIPFLLAIAQKAYPEGFDVAASKAWLEKVITLPNALVLRRERSGLVASLTTNFWQPSVLRCAVVFLAGDDPSPWELMSLVRASIEWGKQSGAKTWRLLNERNGVDISAIAARVGARPLLATDFIMEL